MRVPIAVLSIAAFLMFSCDETAEGCLDLLAENYSFEAVNACDSCCSYPTASISLSFIQDTLSFDINDTLMVGNGDSVLIQDWVFLLSEFVFSSQTMDYTVRASVRTSMVSAQDDFIVFLDKGSKQIGNTAFQDTLNRVQFRTGFNTEEMELFKPFDNLDQDSRLDLALDSMYNSMTDKYYSMRFMLEFPEQDRIVHVDIENNDILVFDGFNYFVKGGSDWFLKMNLDLTKLFSGISSDLTDDDILQIIAGNIQSSIHLE